DVRRLPGSHASRPCAGERFSPSMIEAYQGQYHRVWEPCTRPPKECTVDGLQPQGSTGSVYSRVHPVACMLSTHPNGRASTPACPRAGVAEPRCAAPGAWGGSLWHQSPCLDGISHRPATPGGERAHRVSLHGSGVLVMGRHTRRQGDAHGRHKTPRKVAEIDRCISRGERIAELRWQTPSFVPAREPENTPGMLLVSTPGGSCQSSASSVTR